MSPNNSPRHYYEQEKQNTKTKQNPTNILGYIFQSNLTLVSCYTGSLKDTGYCTHISCVYDYTFHDYGS